MQHDVLNTLAGRIHTPAYIFDTDEFAARAQMVQEAFGERTALCFSIKANPFLLKALPDTFQKIEVCSPGELTICETLGIDMDKVIFSGVNKTKADVERAMDDKVGVFTAESYLHMELINSAALTRGLRVPVLVRLTAGSQFGLDESDVLDIIDRRDQYAGIDIVGIHYFSGTQKRKAKATIKELDMLMAFFAKLETEHGFHPQRLEYGTGLAVDYFTEDAETSERERLSEIAEKIREVSAQTELTVEMGRFFAAPCGYYCTKVMDTKCNLGIRYAILDGGLNQLKYDGQIQGMQLPVITHWKNTAPAAETAPEPWTLCGSLCTTADVLARNAQFSDLQIGDILIFHRTGAYSVMEGMAVFLSREMPEVHLYSAEHGLEMLRRICFTDSLNTPMAYL